MKKFRILLIVCIVFISLFLTLVNASAQKNKIRYYADSLVPDYGANFTAKAKEVKDLTQSVEYTYNIKVTQYKVKRYVVLLKNNGYWEHSANDKDLSNGEIYISLERVYVTVTYDGKILKIEYTKEPVTVELYDNWGVKHKVYEDQVEEKLADGWSYDMPTVILYNKNGEQKEVDAVDVNTKLSQGWYTYPVQTLYTADGRSEVFAKSEVQAQLSVGWSEEPFQRLYSKDNNPKMVKISEVESHLKNGWYTDLVTTVYALDGRTKIILQKELEAYKKVGWYNGTPVLAYALDGRTKYIGLNEVVAEEKVGWYYGKPIKVYDKYGAYITIGENRLTYYKSLGYSATRPPVGRVFIDTEIPSFEYFSGIQPSKVLVTPTSVMSFVKYTYKNVDQKIFQDYLNCLRYDDFDVIRNVGEGTSVSYSVGHSVVKRYEEESDEAFDELLGFDEKYSNSRLSIERLKILADTIQRNYKDSQNDYYSAKSRFECSIKYSDGTLEIGTCNILIDF